MDRVYTGDITIHTPGGYGCRITRVTVSPLQVEAEFEMLEPVPDDVNLFFDELDTGSLRISGEQETVGASRSGGTITADEARNISGTVLCGPFDRVTDPAAVEAVQIGGTWVDLSDMTLES